MFAADARASTAGTIGQSRVKRPTLTSRNSRSLSTDCHSPLYIFDALSCARIDSGGTSVDRFRNGFCLRPPWKYPISVLFLLSFPVPLPVRLLNLPTSVATLRETPATCLSILNWL